MSNAARGGPKQRSLRHDFWRVRAARVIAAALAHAWLGHLGVAHAAVNPNVSLVVTGCAEAQVPFDRLFEFVRTEVSPFNLVLARTSLYAEIHGTIALCYGSADRVWMQVSGVQGNVERVVELSDVVGELRVRTLAVTFAEMLTVLDARVAPPASPTNATPYRPMTSRVVPPSLADAPTETQNPLTSVQRPTVSQVTSRSNHVRVGAGGAVRQFANPSTTLTGPWLSIASGPWQGEVLLLLANRRVTAGSVQLREFNVAALYAPLQLGDAIRVRLGLRGEIGMNWLSGTPDANRRAIGTTVQRIQAALLVEPRLEVAVGSMIVAEGRLAIGVAYGPTARANGDPTLTSGGSYLGASLGCVVQF